MKRKQWILVLAVVLSVFCAGSMTAGATEGAGGSFSTPGQSGKIEDVYSDRISGLGMASSSTSSEISTVSLNIFPGSYGAQLEQSQDATARIMYNEMEKYYVKAGQTGSLTFSCEFPFSGTGDYGTSSGYLSAKDALDYALASASSALLYDYPELFWSSGLKYEWKVAGSKFSDGRFEARITGVTMGFYEAYAGAKQQQSAFDAAVAGAVSTVTGMRTDATQYQTLKAIHDYVCARITYPSNYGTGNSGGIIPQYHSAAGMFLKGGIAVCEGYAKSFMILCRKFNIPAILVVGDAGGPHMWNYVQVGGNWYAVDTTWDDREGMAADSSYFMIGSRTVIRGTAFGSSRRLNSYFTESTNCKKFSYPILNGSAYQTSAAVHTHDWQVVSETKPTCENDGISSYRCACGESSFDVEEAFGHAFVLQQVIQPTCTAAGESVYRCSHCENVRRQETAPPLGHSFSGQNFVYNNDATALQDGTKTPICDRCGAQGTPVPAAGTRLPATLQLNVSSVPLRQGQSTSALKVSGLAKGDAVLRWTSSNAKVVKVNPSTGKITAKKWSGKKKKTAWITVTLLSGLSKSVKVTVQPGTVKTTKISGLAGNITMQKGQKRKLTPVLTPITSQQKVTYRSSSKKVVSVSSKGQLKARKKGNATITIKSGNKTFTCRVTVK